VKEQSHLRFGGNTAIRHCPMGNRQPISPAVLMERTIDAGCLPDPRPILILRAKGLKRSSYAERRKAETALELTQFEAGTIGHILQQPTVYTACQRMEVESLVESGYPLRKQSGFVPTGLHISCVHHESADAAGGMWNSIRKMHFSVGETGKCRCIDSHEAKLLYL